MVYYCGLVLVGLCLNCILVVVGLCLLVAHCGYRLFSGFVVGMFCCFDFVGNGWCGWWLNLLFSVLCLICFVIVGVVCLGDGEFVLVNGVVGAFVVWVGL